MVKKEKKDVSEKILKDLILMIQNKGTPLHVIREEKRKEERKRIKSEKFKGTKRV